MFEALYDWLFYFFYSTHTLFKMLSIISNTREVIKLSYIVQVLLELQLPHIVIS